MTGTRVEAILENASERIDSTAKLDFIQLSYIDSNIPQTLKKGRETLIISVDSGEIEKSRKISVPKQVHRKKVGNDFSCDRLRG